MTTVSFHQRVDIVLLIQRLWFIQDEDRQTVDYNATPLSYGYYLLVADGEVLITSKTGFIRAMSPDGTRTQASKVAV